MHESALLLLKFSRARSRRGEGAAAVVVSRQFLVSRMLRSRRGERAATVVVSRQFLVSRVPRSRGGGGCGDGCSV